MVDDSFEVGKLVFINRNLTSNDLMEDGSDALVLPEGSAGVIGDETDVEGDSIEVIFNKSQGWYLKKEWISFDANGLFIPVSWKASPESLGVKPQYDLSWFVNHIRELEKKIVEQVDHIEAIEDERNVYLEAFAALEIEPGIATSIGRHDICPKCFESWTTHNSDGSCIVDDDDTDWKDLYMNEIIEHYKDAVLINEFQDGTDDWDWGDIEYWGASTLKKHGYTQEEIMALKTEAIEDQEEEFDSFTNDEIDEMKRMALPPEEMEDDDDDDDDDEGNSRTTVELELEVRPTKITPDLQSDLEEDIY